LEFELQARGLHADSQRTLNVKYKDRMIGKFKADLVVEEMDHPTNAQYYKIPQFADRG
jgi:hypothetical protein